MKSEPDPNMLDTFRTKTRIELEKLGITGEQAERILDRQEGFIRITYSHGLKDGLKAKSG